DLLKDFKPAFLGRVYVIPYLPLSRDVLIEIADLKISKIRKRIENNYKAETEICAKLIGSIVDNCNESGSGARALQTVIARRLMPKISDAILSAVVKQTPVDKVVNQAELDDLIVSIQFHG